MITVEKPNNVVTSGIQNAVSFGIKQEGLAHIFSVLRNQLYSDKILAVIREYSTNAVDAHVEAGKANEPIRVTLPSRFSTTFKIRDFGLGLSEQDIQDIYAFYGESTKRKSNQMIGQLGLGSKSAFAYGDNFVITSFVDGVKTTYNAFIDASQIGQIAKLASEPTDEQNGVEISIAVNEHDIQAFHDKACNLFRYFKVKPEIDGASFNYDVKTPIIESADWRVFGGVSVAIMGNIGYPLDNHWPNDGAITNALAAGIEIDFNIGDLEIAASREKLQYSDATKKAIKDKLARITKEIVQIMNDKFANCATLLDAMKLYGQVMDYGSSFYHLRNLVTKNLTFKGKPIQGSRLHFNIPTNGDWSVRRYEKSYRGSKINSYVANVFECDEKLLIVENDLNIRFGITNRIYNLVTNGKRVYVVSLKDTAAKADFFTKTGLEQSNLVLLSAYPKISLSTATGTTYVKNTKHSSKEFVFDLDYAKKASSWHRKYSDFWKQESVDVENDAGLYVMLETFQCKDKNANWISPTDLKQVIEKLDTLGIKIGKVYGFKTKHADKIKKNKNMVCLWKHISVELENYFNKNKVSQKVADRIAYDQNAEIKWLEFLEKNGSDAKAKTLMFKTAEVFAEMKNASEKKKLDLCVEWKEYIKPMTPTHDLKAAIKAFEAQYPLIPHVDRWDYSNSKVAKAMVDYANMIDG
jgi:flagellin-like hook-associated protein FlgL